MDELRSKRLEQQTDFQWGRADERSFTPLRHSDHIRAHEAHPPHLGSSRIAAKDAATLAGKVRRGSAVSPKRLRGKSSRHRHPLGTSPRFARFSVPGTLKLRATFGNLPIACNHRSC
jgi:hypothetical protein